MQITFFFLVKILVSEQLSKVSEALDLMLRRAVGKERTMYTF